MDQLKQQFKEYFDIEENKLNQLVSIFKKVELSKGNNFICQDEKCDKLAFIKSGVIRIHTCVEGEDITQWIATNGYYVTDLASFMQNGKSRWTISSLTNSILYTVTKSDYNTINTFIPDWADKEKEFIIHCFTILENRILQFLSMSAEERFTAYFSQNKIIFNEIPQHYIASMLGMTPETLSRIRKKT